MYLIYLFLTIIFIVLSKLGETHVRSTGDAALTRRDEMVKLIMQRERYLDYEASKAHKRWKNTLNCGVVLELELVSDACNHHSCRAIVFTTSMSPGSIS